MPLFGEIPRPNWIEIDLDNLQSNISYIKKIIPKGTKILLPVKADAYGHGSLAISFAAIEAGVDFLGVAHLFEGVALRENGVKARILILGPCLETDIETVLKYDLTPSVQDYETARKMSEPGLAADNKKTLGSSVASLGVSEFKNVQNKLKIHIQVDTGMHRFGVQDFEEVRKICELKNIEVEGIYSHFATADMPENNATEMQLSRFENIVQELKKLRICPPLYHIANSPATLFFTEKTHYDMVRPGIALYGYDFPQLKPVLRLRSTVRAIREVKKGEGISYGHFFIAPKDMKVATIAIGYGDGYLRGKPNQGVIFVGGKACPILGRVCMDACMIDVSDLPNIKIGDIAECINGEYSEQISMETFAKEHGTISYEITTRMARRLYRIYRYKGKMSGWDEVKRDISIYS